MTPPFPLPRKVYTTDLTDSEWKLIEPFFSPPKSLGRPLVHGWRAIANAVFYRLRSGCQWRNLPGDLPPWGTVHYYARKWRIDGLWKKINDALVRESRRRSGRDCEPSVAVLDSQSVRADEKGGACSVASTRARRSRAGSATC